MALPHDATADALHAAIVAGSGRIGVDDGPASSASFMMPAQLAVDKAGTIYVSDTAAQRIRTISKTGVVSTLAGSGPIDASGTWVDGGYADGPALAARFDRPDGIAVASDGSILVSDRDNHCIRRIASGSVTTYAGSAAAPGSSDGDRGTARFESPRGLAVDHDGAIYVADWGVGLRKISPQGIVTTIRPIGATLDRPTGVAVAYSGKQLPPAVFVADAKGLVRISLDTLKAARVHAFPSGSEDPATPSVSSDVPLGVPHGIAAFDLADVVYTDLRDSTVKYLRVASYLRYLGETPKEDAMLTGGSAAFSPNAPSYDAPMGVAVDDRGDVLVADTGNRRIVRIDPFDRKWFVTGNDLSKLNFAAGSYRIAVVGSSFTWWGSSVDDSIAGLLQADLASVPALQKRPPATRYFQISLRGEFDLMDNVLALGSVDDVVLLLSPIDPLGLELGPAPSQWGPFVREHLQRTVAALRAAHIPMLLVINPAAQTVSPLESAYVFQGREADSGTDYDVEHQALLAIIKGIDVPVLDLYPAFRDEIAQPDHRPLFLTANTHYSAYGREFVAGKIYDELLRLQPWSGT